MELIMKINDSSYYEDKLLKAIEERNTKLFSSLLAEVESSKVRKTFLTLWKTSKTNMLMETTIKRLDKHFSSLSDKANALEKARSKLPAFLRQGGFKHIRVRRQGQRLALLSGVEFLSAGGQALFRDANETPGASSPASKRRKVAADTKLVELHSAKAFHFTHFLLKVEGGQFRFLANQPFKRALFFHHESETQLVFKNTKQLSHLLNQGSYSLDLDGERYQITLQ